MTNIRKTLAIPTHRIDMKPITLLAASFCLLTLTSAHAIDAKYREKLERSGCTQVSEMQGCDINKTRAENAKAGFTNDAAPAAASKAAPAVKPSFDCAKAKPGSIEALICADTALAALDRQLADVYAAARKKAANEKPPVLQAEQRGWVKGRDECWKAQQSGQATCIRDAYQQRIVELLDPLQAAFVGFAFLLDQRDARRELQGVVLNEQRAGLQRKGADMAALDQHKGGAGLHVEAPQVATAAVLGAEQQAQVVLVPAQRRLDLVIPIL